MNINETKIKYLKITASLPPIENCEVRDDFAYSVYMARRIGCTPSEAQAAQAQLIKEGKYP